MNTKTQWHKVVIAEGQNWPDITGPTMTLRFNTATVASQNDTLSVWERSQSVVDIMATLGEAVEHDIDLPYGVSELYFSPGAEAVFASGLSGFELKPCDRPDRTEVKLVVGDESKARALLA